VVVVLLDEDELKDDKDEAVDVFEDDVLVDEEEVDDITDEEAEDVDECVVEDVEGASDEVVADFGVTAMLELVVLGAAVILK
jgi:hypothetical protein